jgi:hypothetical protein
MPPKKARFEKNQQKISFFTTSEKENPWSEDETNTGTTTETNEPIYDDVPSLGVRHPSVNFKKKSSPLKLLGQFKPSLA